MSEGEIIDCNKNEKHKTVIILLFFTFAIDSKIKKLLQIKARNNDGEKPDNLGLQVLVGYPVDIRREEV